ncbi:hypothetical protein ACA910_020046 [Epithemia clementina (nom. ined.)]
MASSSYPVENPKTKHDLKSQRLPPPGKSLQESDLIFTSTPSLFQTVIKEIPTDLKPLASVYSYSDAPEPPLSRELCIVGVADVSLSLVRKLIGDEDDIPDCLHKCVVAVKRGDGEHMRQLDTKHTINSKAFAQFMQKLRQDNVVAILGKDKCERFGMLKPIEKVGKEKYNKEDFYCSCYVGNISAVKDYLTGGKTSSRAQKEESAASGHDDAMDIPIWKPPDEDDGHFGKQSADEVSGSLWQPPGMGSTDGGGSSSGDLWQPPGSGGDSGGGDSFSWQPPESSGFSSSFGNDAWDANDATTTTASNSANSNYDSTAKRKREDDSKGESGFHADTGAAAADAFYSGLTRSLDTRADSKLFHMRAFNGWVKATQIQELDPKTKSSGKKMGGPIRILDLACGKGGDLGKWIMHPRGIKEYVGSDVARGSLKDAAIRARQMRQRGLKLCTFTCADLGHDVPGRLRSPKQKHMQKLLTWSLQNEPEHTSEPPDFQMVRGGGIRPDQMFDVVSIQFAIHYMMSTQQRARRFFYTVSQLLEVGGNLIATTIDARVVIEHMMNLGADLHFDDDKDIANREPLEIKVGAGACRIRFEPEIVAKIVKSTSDGSADCKDLFGLEYTFTLVEGSDHGAGVGDAVNLPEWLTPIPVLESLGMEVGLELECAENFHEFFKNRNDPSVHAGAHSSLYSMKVLNLNGSISPDEWEISRLYCAVKFRKVRDPDFDWVEGEDEDNGDEDDDDDNEDEEVDPKLKLKLMPMAMMKAKKAAGNDAWANLTPEEKTKRTEVELRKLAKAN